MVEKSIETNLRALDVEPSFAAAHNNLAIAFLENGDHHSAMEHCDRAIEIGYDVAPEIIKDLEKYR